jgi:anti-anti-sigma regulatory factor
MTGTFKITKIDNNKIIVKLEGDFDCDESIALSFEMACVIQNLNNVYVVYDISELSSMTEGAKGIIGTEHRRNL